MIRHLILLLAVLLALAAQAEYLLTDAEREKSAEYFVMDASAYIANKGRHVQDPDTRSGWATVADPADQPGSGYLWYGYTYRQVPGRVRATYRLKVADNTIADPIASVQVCFWNNDLKKNPNSMPAIKGTDFKQPNVYQEISFEITKGEVGFGGWGVNTTGKTKLSFDYVKIEQISRFTPAELLPLLNLPERPANLTLTTDKLRVHEADGLYADMWGVQPAVGFILATRFPGAERTQSNYENMNGQRVGLKGAFPRKWEDLYKYKAVVLNNVSAQVVSVVGTVMLKQYMEDGGTVIFLGDTHGLSGGKWDESLLAPLFPVDLSKTTTATYSPKPLYLQPRTKGLKEIDWSAKPYAIYNRTTALRPGATVLLAAGNDPLAVESKVGKGRFVVVLLSIYGEKYSKSPGVPFWEWSNWPMVMAGLVAP
ncbi:MAG: hypothetical protein ACYDBB_11510 [Armatimonadota bacterium]